MAKLKVVMSVKTAYELELDVPGWEDGDEEAVFAGVEELLRETGRTIDEIANHTFVVNEEIAEVEVLDGRDFHAKIPEKVRAVAWKDDF